MPEGRAVAACRSGRKGIPKDDIGTGIFVKEPGLDEDAHAKCAIYKANGDCITPKKGILCRVLEGGRVSVGDKVEWS